MTEAGHRSPLRIALVTNIPAPYRLPVYERLAQEPGVELCVFFCSGREPDRHWDLAPSRFRQVFLRERFVTFRGRFIHFNPDTCRQLRTFRPNVVVTTGFNPTHLLAYACARIYGARHVAMTDGTLDSEAGLTWIHRWVRRIVYSGTRAFIGASDGSSALYRGYGIDPTRIFKSHLCSDNAAFVAAGPVQKQFDFIFCGRFVAVKNPHFAIEVARRVALRLERRVSILFVGSGELEPEIRAAVAAIEDDVAATFAGFVTQNELPQHYGSARIFLFPTQWDPWGVVANEACAAGLPVIVTPAAGSAGELIRHGENGFVLPLDVDRWTDAAANLLTDADLYAAMSANSRALVQEYSFANAAQGITDACRAAYRQEHGHTDRGQLLKVAIIQRRLTHYREPLFELMRADLEKRGISLTVVFGDPTPDEKQKADSGSLSWGVHVPTRYFLKGRLCWQNASTAIRDADLVVVTQENKLLFNHVLAMQANRFRLAFWGHGRNFQAQHANSLSEQFKKWLARRVDWWFGYTELSAEAVLKLGVPADRITVLNNAIDTGALHDHVQSLTACEIEAARQALGMTSGPVGVLVASLHADKRLPFMLQAADVVRSRIPDFQLLVVGDGPEHALVEQAARQSGGWIHYLGARKGREKALFLAMSKVMLNPGMVGLGVLDSFVAGVPMVTTDCNLHSPEIAYVRSGVNGLMTENTIQAFAEGVISVLNDEVLYARLVTHCKLSAQEITVQNMAKNFCDGIQRCLSSNGALREPLVVL